MTHIDYQDLLGVPYRYRAEFGSGETDCVGIGVEVFRRAGWSLTALPTAEDAFASAVEGLESDPSGHPWEEVQGAVSSLGRVDVRLEFGDVLLSRAGSTLHVSIVVDDRVQAVLSSGERWGSFVVPAGRVTNVAAVYRLKDRPPVGTP